jgi:hypothetical protein
MLKEPRVDEQSELVGILGFRSLHIVRISLLVGPLRKVSQY